MSADGTLFLHPAFFRDSADHLCEFDAASVDHPVSSVWSHEVHTISFSSKSLSLATP